MANIVVWIRNDLRLQDNTALINAVNAISNNDKLILATYIDDLALIEGFNSRRYFYSALNNFYQQCLKDGIDIYFMYGDLNKSFNNLIEQFQDVSDLYFNIIETGIGYQQAIDLIASLTKTDILIHSYHDHYLHEATAILKADLSPYQVFTAYYKQWIKSDKKVPQSLDIEKLKSLSNPNIAILNQDGKRYFKHIITKLNNAYSHQIGEQLANNQLQTFISSKLQDYDVNRDYPSLNGISGLSQFINSGQLSIRQIYQSVMQCMPSNGQITFIKELAWRDFYNMIYYFQSYAKDVEIIAKYRHLNWSYNNDNLRKWQDGETGFPLVDAAMMQLNQEGLMHNRLRMVSACFLVKDLLIDWRCGEQYFEKMLIDYDSASNIGGWQWAASVGIDAVPYFRVFNPISQSMKYDKMGEYIKQYLPQLKDIPVSYIHEPYKYQDILLVDYQIDITQIYPPPMVDHDKQRKLAIAMFKESDHERNNDEAKSID